MDTHYEIPPRLRLNRQASSFTATIDDSNFHNTFNLERERDASDGGDDDGSTPRLGVNKMSVDSFDEPLHFSAQAQAQSTPVPLRDTAADREATPAERLRAVLSRASSLTPTVRTQNYLLEKTPTASAANLRESDMESDDFETPRNPANGVPATPYAQSQNSTVSIANSVARESVRSIFAHALRSPGNTPERPRRPRRGSMDSSIVAESPIKWSMLKPSERMKRLSLSDDEKEKIKASRSRFADEKSMESFTSSQAAIYDQLRQRLEGPHSNRNPNKGKSVAKSDMTIDMEEATEVEEQLLKDRNVPIKSSTPPVVSNVSMTQQSMSQFPSQFLGSNLLTENSDMQRMIEKAQTDTTDSEAPQSSHKNDKTPMAGPSSDVATARPSLVRQRTLSRNGSIGSLSSSSSRPTSRQSMNDFDDGDLKRERERGWNHPLGPYMERHRATSPLYSVTHSGGLARMRKISLGSISGSESDAGRLSPMSVRKNGDQQVPSKYGGVTSGRFSSSPNQIRVSARIRTVSQPTKPSSPRSLANSTNSDGTQGPLDRSRTVSLNAHNSSRPPSSHAHARQDSARNRNSVHVMEQAVRPASPSSSRSSSRASSHQSEAPRGLEQVHVRERNWNSPRPKWNVTGSPSLTLSERNQPGNTAQMRTPPTAHPSHARGPHATGASPSSIPKLSVNGRSNSTRRTGAVKGDEVDDHKARNSTALATISTNTLVNGRRASPGLNKDARQPTTSKVDHKAFSQHEHDRGHSRPRSPTPSTEMNSAEDSEEHDTPKIGQQRIPELPTPDSGSRPNSRAGTSSNFPSQGSKTVDNRVNVQSAASASVREKERHRSDAQPKKSTRLSRVSMASEPIDLHDSDLDSFQEEDIVASSSAPRLLHGSDSFDENDTNSQAEELHAGFNALRPRQDLRPNGHAHEPNGKVLSLPANFSPPLSPPVSPPDLVTSTPQGRGSANSSKVAFRTPSPPKGMPALPEPPLSDDDAASDKTPPVPVTPANRNRYADMKTPRLPGAWATPSATPAPAATARMSTLHRDTRPEDKQVTVQNEIYTLPASYSRGTSMIMKTPAPPGAWLATPATIAAKRLQQKVRFDEQEKSAASDPVPTGDDGMLSSEISAGDGGVAMKGAGKGKPTSPRTPGRIRVVDAFGNEIAHSKSEDQKGPVQKTDELHATERDEKSMASASRKTRVRVLDAMGREIDESQVHSSLPADEPVKHRMKAEGDNVTTSIQSLDVQKLERKQALQMLQKTIAELKDGFNEVEDPASTKTTENIDAQIADLKARSIRAKEYRERLLRKIKESEMGGPPSRMKAIWNALLYGKNAVGISNRTAYFKVFVTLIFLQMIMFLAFYRLTSMGARQMFLTTYIDPFYPELYVHVTDPDYLHPSMTPNAYSELPISTYSSWLATILALLRAFLNRILILKESLWDVWRDAPQTIPWPPT